VTAAPTLKRALSAFRDRTLSESKICAGYGSRGRPPNGSQRLWDSEGWDVLSTRQVQLARNDGALGVLPIALNQRAAVHLHRADFGAGLVVDRRGRGNR
jgi:hypothetical protein